MKKLLVGWIATLGLSLMTLHAGVDVVANPVSSGTNRLYVGNLPPLEPSRFIALPTGSVQPQGWLLTVLKRQRDGLSGHLEEISSWLRKTNNAWLSREGRGEKGWEELPYWLRGYIELAYLLKDPKMIEGSRFWIEGAINTRRPDGDFGPDIQIGAHAQPYPRESGGIRDFWPNMVMLFCLESYYEQTSDPRVPEMMTKYFAYQLALPDEQLLPRSFGKVRAGDELYSIYWLYNRTGNPDLLKLAERIHHRTLDWEKKSDLPSWHNVDIAEGFREPALRFVQTRQQTDLQATYDNFQEVRKRFGQVPGGMYGGDENCRAGYSDPRQAVETCAMVEQMFSDELLTQFTGDAFWADNCEEVAFNSYPAALTPDLRALRYLTAPNMPVSDSMNHNPGTDNKGNKMQYCPESYRCCLHNHAMGWPSYAKHLWLASPDQGLCASLYSACEVMAKVGDGTGVRIEEKTHYPFDDQIQIAMHPEKAIAFPLYLRIPGWCDGATVLINGSKQDIFLAAGKYVRINRTWKEGDRVELNLPMKVSVHRWTANHDSVSVNYGALTFSLKIGEAAKTTYRGKKADPNQQWPLTELYPATPWNYGLLLDDAHPEKSFTVKRLGWPQDDYPFTPASAPIQLVVKAKQIPEWTLDQYGLCAVLQPSPVRSVRLEESVTLIPMGAARLRISAFPTIGTGADAHQWVASAVPKELLGKASASHIGTNDSLKAIGNEVVPASSKDQSIPRFTWWDHQGTTEWVQYDFSQPREVSAVEVYWFDDTGNGKCRAPKSWRLLYEVGGEWRAVPGAVTTAATVDQFNSVSFPVLSTSALRIEADLQPGFSGGILKWRVKP